ncbi:hypothetical protein D3C85_1317390 [compost metagenome]
MLKRNSAPRSRAAPSRTGSSRCCGALHIWLGLASSYSALRSGEVPQVCRRAISMPAKLVAQTLLLISSLGVAMERNRSSMPRSRNTSTVRWFVM